MPIRALVLPSSRTRLLGLLFTLAAASASFATAQTAPQLLPYTAKAVAGGGTSAIAKNAACPVSGLTSTDAYGDGCLATEVQLTAPRYAIADSNGNVYFSDYANGLVRRVDAVTGVVTLIAGSAASSPGVGACGTNVSIDARGDGCLATAVHLTAPEGLALALNGDLYFADSGQYDVRKVTAATGIISNVAGYAAGAATRGYSSGVVAATASYLYAPFGIALDTKGNLFIAEEYKNAILVVNTNTTGSNTVNNITVPAGQIVKITGASTTAPAPNPLCPNGTSGTYGCSYNPFVEGAAANADYLDAPYSVAVDPTGTVYIANEYNQVVPKVSPAGILTTFAGNQSSYGKVITTRAKAGTFAIGSDFGVAADALANVYITDALNGVIWRVDGTTQSMYVVAGGGTATCTAGATDAYGDNCPALSATFGKSGTSYASTSGNTAGIFGISADVNSNIYVGDTITNLVREISSGTQFGAVGAGQPTQTLKIHFANGDLPASANPYTLTSGNNNFSLGTATCLPTNTDGTTDCTLPVTATPSTLGAFSGTLQVTAQIGGSASFNLSGTYIQSPNTRTAVSYTTGVTCTGTTTFSSATPISITATLTANGPAPPVGAADTITFFANSGSGAMQLGNPVPVSNIGTAANPVYGATINYTFATTGTYTLSATYSGDAYFRASTGTSSKTVSSSTASFSVVPTAYATTPPIVAGQTALYSFNVIQNVYTGTFTFACSGLPTGATCSFSPSTITATGCSTTSTIALSILTTPPPIVLSSMGYLGIGPWSLLGVLPCLALAMFLGLRRRSTFGKLGGQIGLMLALLLTASGLLACGNGIKGPAATPSGSYPLTVTTTSSTGVAIGFPLTLVVK